jgi:SAM-dependent methyltransferase
MKHMGGVRVSEVEKPGCELSLLSSRQLASACEFGERDGILEAIGPLAGRNRIAAAFYDGPGWARFRRFEQGFLRVVGGVRRARRQILQALDVPAGPRLLALEVGIGHGANVPFLDPRYVLHGVDLARSRLAECLTRHPAMTGKLVWAEAENLPYDDHVFHVCFSIGGFNYFQDHQQALSEMRRVTRPGGCLVVADESPSLCRLGIGHMIGQPGLDLWWLTRLGLDREFAEMVISFDVDIPEVFARAWPQARRLAIWRGLGYCYVDRVIPT